MLSSPINFTLSDAESFYLFVFNPKLVNLVDGADMMARFDNLSCVKDFSPVRVDSQKSSGIYCPKDAPNFPLSCLEAVLKIDGNVYREYISGLTDETFSSHGRRITTEEYYEYLVCDYFPPAWEDLLFCDLMLKKRASGDDIWALVFEVAAHSDMYDSEEWVEIEINFEIQCRSEAEFFEKLLEKGWAGRRAAPSHWHCEPVLRCARSSESRSTVRVMVGIRSQSRSSWAVLLLLPQLSAILDRTGHTASASSPMW